MKATHQVLEKCYLKSPFKDISWVLDLKHKDFNTVYGYSLLELLVIQKDNLAFTKNIWDFFENDLELKEHAKKMNKLELFICFKRLLLQIYLEEISLNELRELVHTEDYWLASIYFYFSIAQPLQNIKVSVIEYSEFEYRMVTNFKEICPLILIANLNDVYYPIALENYKPVTSSKFPFAIYNGIDLSSYLDDYAAESIFICPSCNSHIIKSSQISNEVLCKNCLNSLNIK